MAYKTPQDCLANRLQNNANDIALHQPVNRVWKTWTWTQIDDNVRRIATGLQGLGLNKGDRVAIFAKNSAEWMLADWALMYTGLISVPIYPTANADTIKYVMQHSDAKAVFVGKLDNPDVVAEAFDPDIPLIAFPYDTARGNIQWAEWIASNDPIKDIHTPADLDEVMSLIYTSGSTGNPKGVVLTYKAYGSNCEAAPKRIPVEPDDRGISYLPLAHIAERVVAEGNLLYSGGSIYFAESLDTFLEDLQHCQPTVFFSVPRLWTKFLANIHEKIPEKKLNFLLSLPIIGNIIRKKIKAQLGFTHTRLWITAAAPIAPDILRAYDKLGINISEAWGMTETTGGSCIAYPYDPDLIGTIGTPQLCVEMKLSDQDEILIRGDAVFSEYYNNPEATAESFTDDGWFKTGDRGAKGPKGSFKIVGRVKEEFKTAKGKYVAPVPIETQLAANPSIEQICVMGSGKPQPYVVVVAAEHLPQEVNEDLRANLRATFDEVNAALESHQRLSHMIVSTHPWTIENAMLTPTMKIRRNVIEEHYGDLSGAADKNKPVIWEDELVSA